jgi:hypothetical protein
MVRHADLDEILHVDLGCVVDHQLVVDELRDRHASSRLLAERNDRLVRVLVVARVRAFGAAALEDEV